MKLLHAIVHILATSIVAESSLINFNTDEEKGGTQPNEVHPSLRGLLATVALSGISSCQSGYYLDQNFECTQACNNNRVQLFGKVYSCSLTTDLTVTGPSYRIIPKRIVGLTSLTNLDLSSNNLKGMIPTELGKLTGLKNLDLSQNNLEGSIPRELSKLSLLTTLNLSHNKHFVGRIPTEMGKLTKLTELDLSHNYFDPEAIPTELGNLSRLKRIDLSNNVHSGIIPTEFGKLTSLTFLSLSGNLLFGSIPSELGSLSMLVSLRAFEGENSSRTLSNWNTSPDRKSCHLGFGP